jgi:flagellar basal-body rod protein FlgC
MSLFSLLSVSASGMSAQRTRAELLVENLANAETTRTPDGGPYRRKDAVFATDAAESPFSSVFESQLGRPDGVRVAEVVVDDRAPSATYLPGHPTRTKTATSRFRASIQPKTWSTSWAQREVTRQMWPPFRRSKT